MTLGLKRIRNLNIHQDPIRLPPIYRWRHREEGGGGEHVPGQEGSPYAPRTPCQARCHGPMYSHIQDSTARQPFPDEERTRKTHRQKKKKVSAGIRARLQQGCIITNPCHPFVHMLTTTNIILRIISTMNLQERRSLFVLKWNRMPPHHTYL